MKIKKINDANSFLREEDGVSAIEFAILTPLFILVLIAIIEIGSAIFVRIDINSRIASLSNYFTISYSPETTESELTYILNAHYGAGIRSIGLNINYSISAMLDGDGFQSSSTETPLSNCYCPSGAGSSVIWGAHTDCGTVCPNGSRAGRYVLISIEGRQIFLFGRFLPANSLAVSNVVVKID